MTSPENTQPIIRAKARLHEYDFEAIQPRMLSMLREAATSTARGVSDPLRVARMLKAVEGALRVMGRKLPVPTDPNFEGNCELVIGALSSPTFLEATPARRQDFVGFFRSTILALAKLQMKARLQSPLFTNATRATAEDLELHRLAFERLTLVEDQVWLWRGWYATSAANVVTALPLYNVYRALGRRFTSELHSGISLYVGSRAAAVAPLVKELATFMSGYPSTMPIELRSSVPTALSPDLLRDPSFADRFWRGFFVWHVSQAYAAGIRMSTIITEWNSQFVSFVEDHLAPLGIIAAPPAGMPKLDARGVPGERTHIRTTSDGQEVRCKLLTDVPIQATDEQALKLLVKDIEEDLQLVLKWSQSEVDATNKRLALRRSLAKKGTVRVIQDVGTNEPGYKWQTDPSNPDWLANAAATFEHYGFCTAKDDPRLRSLYEPLAVAARELGLPVSDVLQPYLNLLVAEHPAITPSFLETLELYDKRGVLAGFVDGDGGSTLCGVKRRRGASLSPQDIPLTPNGRALILQIIELTQPLRDYLRRKGDGKWRYLLLSSGQGFGDPKIFNTSTRIPGKLEKNAAQLASVCGVSEARALALLKRCRLMTIRASKAVLIYVETGSVEAMAKALGHAEYDEALLASYLPRPIVEFFRERWIRLFQTGVILEALKGSPYRFRAAAFASASEMDEFLKNHAIRTIALDPNPGTEHRAPEVMFGLDVEILTLLASLCAAVTSSRIAVNPIALYWTKLARKLFAYIESPQCMRHDIRDSLVKAYERIDVSLVQGVLHA